MEFEAEYILLRGTFLGDLQIRYYGIIIVTAMIIAAYVAARLASSRKLNPDHVWGGLTWAIFPGIIAARLWFVLFPPISLTAGCGDPNSTRVCMDTAWFLQNFFNTTNGAIAIWNGGLSIFGAVLGGALGAWLYTSRFHNSISRVFHYIFLPIAIPLTFIFWAIEALYQRIRGEEVEPYSIPKFEPEFPDEGIDYKPWLDIAAVALPLAQAIGRWANYVNQELYGLPTGSSFWGITIDASKRTGEYASLVEYPADTLFHPIFLYEAIWSAIAFVVLYILYTRYKNRFLNGDLFLIYVMQYSVIRFLLEFLRIEVAYIPGTTINSSQAMTVVTFLLALGVYIWRGRGGRRAAAAEVPQQSKPSPSRDSAHAEPVH
ncbi:prolipoprotein diacylglyceryl transferase [Phototrophicus methaneseepsis]|uniref:Phosphatidylglycerol--prolipoprotein diacylglyceryl transferase n=1 Tax=Phototrophicus methaneseepsis TaxID=2710758 RepID=A0A7S8IFN6_9CHLR|nr:prolipoprotein diacylglyceryl transferase [Phototrophicus methaneseepsis]QPC84915.1 prolipoprotein diacylglyceryl transferase [Phototrophicus methaneseepsis]